MRHRGWLRWICAPAVVVVAIMVSAAGSGPLPDLTGAWVGTWEDTRYNAMDTLGLNVTVSTGAVSATGTIGMSYFGAPDEAATGAGTINGDTLDFTFTSPTISGSGRIVGGNVVDGVGTVGGTLGFGGFTFAGAVSSSQWLIDFEFDSPSGGFGVISLSNVVGTEAHSWGAIKARYAGDGD